MIELIFVVVVIGILAAIALPRLGGTMEIAYDTKAKDTIASVRSSISLIRQKNILKGRFLNLNKSSLGDSSDPFKNVLNTPVKTCSSTGCGGWQVGGDNINPTYTFHATNNQDVTFKLENNKLNCISASDICKLYE
jgi:general secretion pathway protein G